MDDPEFKDFPISYRLSQRMMLAAIAALFISKKLAAPQWPVAAIWGLAGVFGAIVLFALVASCYVVIRYPYLSLVHTRDGDIFSKQFTSKTVTRVIKVLGFFITGAILLLLLVVLAHEAWTKGAVDPIEAALLAYVVILFGFIVYLCFIYDAELQPTIATFIRSTLGIGIVLVPLFIPVLIVVSLRCRRLLEAEILRQQIESNALKSGRTS